MDSKISNLTELTSVADVDELVIVDKSDTTQSASGTTKKVIPTVFAERTETLTNKTINADNNTITNIGFDELKSEILTSIYPVGSIFVSGSSTMPTEIASIGTWARIQGRIIVGASDTDHDFDVNDTGGEKTHLLTSAESGVPAHTHTATTTGYTHFGAEETYGHATGYGIPWVFSSLGIPVTTVSNNTPANASSAHNNMPPYKAKYIWERTA